MEMEIQQLGLSSIEVHKLYFLSYFTIILRSADANQRPCHDVNQDMDFIS